MASQIDTDQIKDWRSIITLIVFVITSKFLKHIPEPHLIRVWLDVIVLFPFHIPVWIPRWLYNHFFDSLSYTRIIPPRDQSGYGKGPGANANGSRAFVKVQFPMDLVTAPLIAVLFLLAILAIGRQEVHDGTVGANSIHPVR